MNRTSLDQKKLCIIKAKIMLSRFYLLASRIPDRINVLVLEIYFIYLSHIRVNQENYIGISPPSIHLRSILEDLWSDHK